MRSMAAPSIWRHVDGDRDRERATSDHGRASTLCRRTTLASVAPRSSATPPPASPQRSRSAVPSRDRADSMAGAHAAS